MPRAACGSFKTMLRTCGTILVVLLGLWSQVCCCQAGLWFGQAVGAVSVPALSSELLDPDEDDRPCRCCHRAESPEDSRPRSTPRPTGSDPCNDCPTCFGSVGWLPAAPELVDLRPSPTVLAILDLAAMEAGAGFRGGILHHAQPPPESVRAGCTLLRLHCALMI